MLTTCAWLIRISGLLLLAAAVLKLTEPWVLRDWIWSEAATSLPLANTLAALALATEGLLGVIFLMQPRERWIWALGCWGAFASVHVWQLIKAPTVACPCLPKFVTWLDRGVGHTALLTICLVFAAAALALGVVGRSVSSRGAVT